MSLITYFSTQPKNNDIPQIFPSPFNGIPHAIAKKAAIQLQASLASQSASLHDFDASDGGKMFGVLVVRDSNQQIGFLSAFSGMLAGQWQLPGFVPPLFDQAQRQSFLPAGEAELARYADKIQALQHCPERNRLDKQLQLLKQKKDADIKALKMIHKANKERRKSERHEASGEAIDAVEKLLVRLSFDSQQDKRQLRLANMDWSSKLNVIQEKLDEIEAQINSLKKSRSKLSNLLHKQVFSGYRLYDFLGEQKPIYDFYDQNHPPGGSGDCAAPKLIHYAQQNHLTPVALAEFWWGASPKAGVRHHGHFYPSCRGKCRPILPYMLKGLDVQAPPLLGQAFDETTPETVYEDDDLVVVNKPSGLLSVPGKEVQDSVLTRLQQRYPDATGPLLVHRLDLSTSGLLLAAKNAKTHTALQHQFEKRSIEKRYVAVLSKRLPEHLDKGSIDLPLRVDLYDRPRQLVCFEHGKAAKTHWRVIKRLQATTRVYFYPVTGRTHQLRMHASHIDGLNAPIVGDNLYGKADERLLLHAERLRLTHPKTGERIEVKVPAPF